MRAMVIHQHGGPEQLQSEERPMPILASLGRLVDAGLLRPHVSVRLPLSEVAEAHRRSETGRTIGKVAVLVRTP